MNKPEKPSDGGGQAWIWILAGLGLFGVAGFCCCGIGGYVALQRAGSMMNLVTEDPAIVAERKEELAKIELPAILKPKAAINIFVMQMVVYQSDDNRNNLMLATMPKQPGESDEEFRKRMSSTVDESEGRKYKSKSGNVLRIEDRTYMINGEERTFQFTEIEEDDGQIRHLYMGVFKGRKQSTMMMLNVYPEDISEEEVEAIFASMK